MLKEEIKSKYWMRKWQKKNWTYFRDLKVGDIFDTSVNNRHQISDRIGDIIFWYRTDKGKEGIYFITKIISEPKKDDAYQNGYSISLQVVKTIVNNPVKLKRTDFHNLMGDIAALNQAGGNTNILEKYEPHKLYELVKGNELLEIQDISKEIHLKDLNKIENIKNQNIDKGIMFNPFLDMNLVRNEVRHLSFLTNLLNPNGTHHQGTLFLKLFLNKILNYTIQSNNQYIQNFCDSESIYVQTEKNTGNGRIDIWIENDEYIIAIEGKTESVDSKDQLNKYDSYLQTQNKPYLLIYLTLIGESPKNNHPQNLLLMDFSDDIMRLMSESLEFQIPKKINETLNEYYNSMIVYLNNFSSTWTYELDLIDEITKNEENYKKYENIKNNYFYNTKKYKYTVIEDIAQVFEKAKAKIERDFFCDLSNILDKVFEKEGFYFNTEESNIFISENPQNIDIDINTDIELILKKRQARSLNVNNLQYENIVQLTGTVFAYTNEDSEEEITAYIIYDSHGLNLIIDRCKGEDNLQRDLFEIENFNILHSSNLEKLLNSKYLLEKIEKCRLKITSALKHIKV